MQNLSFNLTQRSTLETLCFFAICVLVSNSLLADDDRFVSENKTTEVRSPVLDQSLPYLNPKRIKKSELSELRAYPASEVKQIASLVNRDAMVIGKVKSVYVPDSQSKVILNMGNDFRECFKVVIDVRDFEKWGTKEPMQIGRLFEGFELAVDGLVSLHQKKPQIVVTLPHQLRVLD